MNVTCIKIHSIIFICHLSWLEKLFPTHTHSLISIHEFSKPYKLLFFELESLFKMLNVTCIQIHSIILSVTCHGLRNFPPTHYTSPQDHLWIFDTLWVIIFWVRVTHKMVNVNCIQIHFNNFICHLSWFKKLSPHSWFWGDVYGVGESFLSHDKWQIKLLSEFFPNSHSTFYEWL